MFTTLAHPIWFSMPKRLAPMSAWHEHIPFAMFLISVLQPKIVVELGTQYGDSYCAFCQAVQELHLNTRCYAIDTWQGDPHTGSYGPEVLKDLSAHHDPLYGGFSLLVQGTFDDALLHFQDRTVDILHIDGYHTYDAVKHDFDTWLPKVSRKGIILFHDINVLKGDFGVHRLWHSLETQYPTFSFSHGHGLGVLSVNKEHPQKLEFLFNASAEERTEIRDFFFQLGSKLSERVRLQHENTTRQAQLEEAQAEGKRLFQQVEEIKRLLDQRECEFQEKSQAVEGLTTSLYNREEQLAFKAQQLNALQTQLGQQQYAAISKDQECERINQALREQTERLEELNGLIHEKEHTLQALQARAEESIEQVNFYKLAVEELKSLVTKQGVLIEFKDKELELLNGNLEKQVATRILLEKQLEEKTHAVKSLEAYLSQKDEQVSAQQNKICELQSSMHEAQQENARKSHELQEALQARHLAESQLEEKTHAVKSLEAYLSQKDEQVSAQQNKICELQSSMHEAQQENARKSHELQEALQARHLAESQLLAITNSKSWRLTAPLRALRGTQEPLVYLPALPVSLQYSIDSILLKGSRLQLWGWMFCEHQGIQSLHLIAESNDKLTSIPCVHGSNRKDVAEAFPGSSSAFTSGFIGVGSLEFDSTHLKKMCLELTLEDCNTYKIPIALNAEFVHNLRKRHFSKWLLEKAYRGSHYLLRRDFKGLYQRVEALHNGHSAQHFLPFLADEFCRRVKPGESVVLVVDHGLGGGANHYREAAIEERLTAGHHVLLVHYNLGSMEYTVTTISHRADRESFCLRSIDDIRKIAQHVQLQEILLNNLVSFEDILGTIQFFVSLKKTSGAKLTIPIHDFYCVCPSFQLANAQGEYCHIPKDLKICENCLAKHTGQWMFWSECRDIHRWRNTWQEVLQVADTILCFSQSSVDLLQRAYEDLDLSNVKLKPHVVDYMPDYTARLDYEAPLNIGIVGNIVLQKGSSVIREMARLIEKEQLQVRITIIGIMDRPPKGNIVKVLGPYERNELPQIIEQSGANVFFLPSVWPETFSYVTDELMRLGVPLAAFNIGAPAERLVHYAKGLIINEINAEAALRTICKWYESLNKEAVAVQQEH